MIKGLFFYGVYVYGGYKTIDSKIEIIPFFYSNSAFSIISRTQKASLRAGFTKYLPIPFFTKPCYSPHRFKFKSMGIRKPAVAGYFYPSDSDRLKRKVEEFTEKVIEPQGKVKGLIVPHAGYEYSGRTAGRVYALVKGKPIKRVLLIGPSHFVDFKGYSFGSFEAFETPLGKVFVDKESIEKYAGGKRELLWDEPHLWEHSLEVQLPFLQLALGDFLLIPVIYGRAKAEDIRALIEHFCDGECLFVISSDLSHYYDDQTARKLDSYCHTWILDGDEDKGKLCEACGKRGIEGALDYAKRKNLRAVLVDYHTSADSSRDKTRVVGYGGYAFIS